MLRRPSTLRYRDLIQRLGEAAGAIERAENVKSSDLSDIRRTQLMYYLRAVILFLHDDAVLNRSTIARPLALITSALHDLGHGAKPALFLPSEFSLNNSGSGDKPTNLYRDFVRAHLASALIVLVDFGRIKLKSAATWLAVESKKLGVLNERGMPIEASQLIRWRYEVRQRKSPRATLEHLDDLDRLHREKAEHLQSAEGAKEWALRMLENLARHGHHHAPAPTRARPALNLSRLKNSEMP